MTSKTKKSVIIGGTSAVCIALICVIATRFKAADTTWDMQSTEETMPSVTVSITTTAPVEPEPELVITINKSEISEEIKPTETTAVTVETQITVNQDFEEVTMPTEPPTPTIDDEAALTNPDQEPEYVPEQTSTAVSTAPPSDNSPKHGDTKDGMIYINGFGWVKDEGGGGAGYVDEEMYQNGNKVGTFG